MRVQILFGCAALLCLGCGGEVVEQARTPEPTSEQRATVEAALKNHGIDNPIASMTEENDRWLVAIAKLAPTKVQKNGVEPLAVPEIYHVMKDGRVLLPSREPARKK